MRPHPRLAEVDPQSPRAWGTCDRCGFVANLYKLAWQYDWRGAKLDNVRILVCEYCYDNPQRQLGVVFIPPDPLPKINARVEQYDVDENPVSTRFTMNGVPRAVRYQPYPILRIVNTVGNVPNTVLSAVPAGAPFTWKQGAVHQNGSGASTTCQASLPARAGIGDLLCVAVGFAAPVNTDSVTITDDKGNSYIGPVDIIADSPTFVLYTFYGANITNSPQTITATNNSNSRQFMSMIVDDFSAGGLSVALDGHSAQSQNGATGRDAVSSGVYATSRNGDLVWGILVSVFNVGMNAGSSFQTGIANNIASAYTSEFKIQSIAGNTAATGTLVASDQTVAASMAFSCS